MRPAATGRQASESALLDGRDEVAPLRRPALLCGNPCAPEHRFGAAQLRFEFGLGLRSHHQTLGDRTASHNRRDEAR